jgi:peptidoglycan hydrolase CwlO-like protein
MTTPDLTTLQKGAWAFRILMSAGMMIATVVGGMILSYVKSSDSKLTRIDSDVNQIKWELPVIKSTMSKDKDEIHARIASIESRIDVLRDLGDNRSEKIADLKTELLLLKQKLNP